MIRLVRVVRNVEFAQLFDDFFIAAITTILAVRFYLKLTGYPQIGNSTLHISHLLPGTVLMLIAIILLLAAVNRAVRYFSAVMAGIGFGLVWDELGKFVTKDNNYFFHATPGLIYLSFVILYLVVRYVSQRRLSQDDYMANVLDLVKDAAINDLDEREYLHAQELLAHVSPNHALYGPTVELLGRVKPRPDRQPSALDKLIGLAKRPLETISQQAFFSKLIIGVAIVYGVASVVAAVFFLAGATLNDVRSVPALLKGDESDVIGGASALAAAACAGYATYKYRRGHHARAYRLFELGLLVNIFIGQVVLFFKSQDIALVWLAITLFLLVNLKIIAADAIRHPRDAYKKL